MLVLVVANLMGLFHKKRGVSPEMFKLLSLMVRITFKVERSTP